MGGVKGERLTEHKEKNSSPFKGEVRRGMGSRGIPINPIPTPALPLKGREKIQSLEIQSLVRATPSLEEALCTSGLDGLDRR